MTGWSSGSGPAPTARAREGPDVVFPSDRAKRLRNGHVTRHNEGADSLARRSMAKQAQIFLVLSLLSE